MFFKFPINTEAMVNVAETLKKLRADATEKSGIKLSMRKLAEESGIGWAAYKGWEVPFRRKRPLNTDEIAKLMPVFTKYGVEAAEVRKLGGLDNPSIQSNTMTPATLDDGRTVLGMPTNIYATPNQHDPFQRPVLPGLLVIAEINFGTVDTPKTKRALYKFMTHHLVEMSDETNPVLPERKLEYSFGDDWFHGTVDIDGAQHNCHIILVPTEWTVKCNKQVFENT